VPHLDAHGLLAELPPGWEGEIFTRGGVPDQHRASAAAVGTAEPPCLHAATFALPAGRGDYGSGAVELMGPADVFLALLEFDAASVGTALFAAQGVGTLTAASFHPQQLQRTLPGQSGTQRFFTAAGRPFCLYVALGSHARRAQLVPLVNGFLGGLSIAG